MHILNIVGIIKSILKKTDSGVNVFLLFCIAIFSSCDFPITEASQENLGEVGSLSININFVKTDNSDKGQWGIFAWVMKGSTYIDTIEFYGDFKKHSDAYSASAEWRNASNNALDGISSSTVKVNSGSSKSYTLSWDGKNYNGTIIPKGDYQIHLIVARHSSTYPIATHYVSNLYLGDKNSNGVFSLKNTSLSPSVFPNNLISSSSVLWRAP